MRAPNSACAPFWALSALEAPEEVAKSKKPDESEVERASEEPDEGHFESGSADGPINHFLVGFSTGFCVENLISTKFGRILREEIIISLYEGGKAENGAREGSAGAIPRILEGGRRIFPG
jgi:hypothetical protein